MTQLAVNQAMIEMARDPDEGAITETKPDNISIQQWYLLERAAIESQMKNVDNQLKEVLAFFSHAAMMHRSRLQQRMNYLNTTYGTEFMTQVSKDLAKAKKKSMAYLAGKAGYRKKPDSLEIVDEALAVADAELNMPSAVKRSILKREVMAQFKKTGEVLGGCRFTKGEDVFFPPIDFVELPSGFEPEPGPRGLT